MPDTDAIGKPPNAGRRVTLAMSLQIQLRVIGALFIRETRTRFGHSMIGYAWVVLEPAFNILLWAGLFSVINRHPGLSDSMLLFLASGFFPFMLFRDLSANMLGAISSNRSLLQFPIVQNIDVILGRALLEVVTSLAVMMLFFVSFAYFGLQGMPRAPIQLIGALLAIALFGFGVGTCNAVLACLFPSYAKIYPWYSRIAYVTSGIFFLPSHMPPVAQDVLWYFPMMHGVEWFREAFFEGYTSSLLSPLFLVSNGLFFAALGLTMERALRRKISVER